MSGTVIIGLTGPTGAGKSKLRDVFEEFGCRYVDCDVLARRAVEPGMPALVQLSEVFGRDIIKPDGTLDRPLLAQRAFPTAEGRERLNGIVHPEVIRLLEEIIADCINSGIAGVIIDAPLLFESGLDTVCRTVIAVIASDELRLERIMLRDGISRESAQLRMSAQHDCEYYSGKSEYTIVNDGTPDELRGQARSILEDIFKGENK